MNASEKMKLILLIEGIILKEQKRRISNRYGVSYSPQFLSTLRALVQCLEQPDAPEDTNKKLRIILNNKWWRGSNPLYEKYDPLYIEIEQCITEELNDDDLTSSGIELQSRVSPNNQEPDELIRGEFTPLQYAVFIRDLDKVKHLLSQSTNINEIGWEGNTALHIAVERGWADGVKLLLENGANINLRNNNRENAFDIALKKHPECIKPILRHLATLPEELQKECLQNAPNGPYDNVLFYAAGNNKDDFDEILTITLKQPDHSFVDKPNSKGWKPLIFAAEIIPLESLKKLIDEGTVKVESQDQHQSTPLLWAVYGGKIDTVKYLVEQGSNLEAKTSLGNTALNFAVMNEQSSVVDYLLSQGANINARNNEGANALAIAIKYKRPELIQTILIHIANLKKDEQAACLENLDGGPYKDIYAYVALEHPDLLNTILIKTAAAPANATKILDNSKLDESLKSFYEHYKIIKKRALTDPNYKGATSAMETLLIRCAHAKVNLVGGEQEDASKIQQFKDECKAAIAEAKPVLEKHRQLEKLIAGFLLAIIAIPVSLTLATMGFFSTKTRSLQKLDQMSEEIDKLTTPTPNSNPNP